MRGHWEREWGWLEVYLRSFMSCAFLAMHGEIRRISSSDCDGSTVVDFPFDLPNVRIAGGGWATQGGGI